VEVGTSGNVLFCALAARFIEWIVALFGRFRSLCPASITWSPIQNLHLVGHDFDCRSLLAPSIFPFPSLQSAFDIDVATAVKVLTANLCQPTEADDLKPLHTFPGSAFCVFPPLVDRKAERPDWLPLLGETNFRRITQKPD
jgi:hypothetical protein